MAITCSHSRPCATAVHSTPGGLLGSSLPQPLGRGKQGHRIQGAAIAAAIAALALGGCSRNETPPDVPPPLVSMTTLAPHDLDIAEELPGRVVPVRVAEIRPQVSGIVERRLFEQGAEIAAGQPLFQIAAAAFQAEADVAAATLKRAESTLARARQQAERLESLVQADAISRSVFDDAIAAREQAAADVAQAAATLARRQLDLKFALVDAPIAGRIDQALVTEGALVGPNDSSPLARVQQIDEVYVDVRQPASSLEAWRDALATSRTGEGKVLPVEIVRDGGQPYNLAGRILFSGINVDAGTGDLLIRVLVPNPRRELLPGMFVRARVPRASYVGALTIPQQAVVRSGGRSYVWTINAGNDAHLLPVELGELVNRSYRIRSGVATGQKVVVEGMERLTEGILVTPSEWSAPDAAASRIEH